MVVCFQFYLFLQFPCQPVEWRLPSHRKTLQQIEIKIEIEMKMEMKMEMQLKKPFAIGQVAEIPEQHS